MKEILKNKKKLVIFSIIGIILIVSIIALIIMHPKEKSNERVSKILKNNYYKIYYDFAGKNNYDDDNYCYDDDLIRKECEREVYFGNISSINIIKASNEKLKFQYSEYTGKNTKDNEDEDNLLMTKEIDDDTEYRYIYNKQTNSIILEYWHYSSYDGESETCEIVIKGKYEDDNNKCDDSISKELKKYNNDVNKEFKKLRLTPDEILDYLIYYFNSIVKNKLQEEKLKLNESLSYDELSQFISDAYYKVYKMDGGSPMLFKDMGLTYSFGLFNTPDISRLFFSYSGKPDLMITYNPSGDTLYGSNKDNSCMYKLVNGILDIKSGDFDGNKENEVMKGKFCTTKEKEDLEYLFTIYEFELTSLNVTTKDLLDFAEMYYDKNN